MSAGHICPAMQGPGKTGSHGLPLTSARVHSGTCCGGACHTPSPPLRRSFERHPGTCCPPLRTTFLLQTQGGVAGGHAGLFPAAGRSERRAPPPGRGALRSRPGRAPPPGNMRAGRFAALRPQPRWPRPRSGSARCPAGHLAGTRRHLRDASGLRTRAPGTRTCRSRSCSRDVRVRMCCLVLTGSFGFLLLSLKSPLCVLGASPSSEM